MQVLTVNINMEQSRVKSGLVNIEEFSEVLEEFSPRFIEKFFPRVKEIFIEEEIPRGNYLNFFPRRIEIFRNSWRKRIPQSVVPRGISFPRATESSYWIQKLIKYRKSFNPFKENLSYIDKPLIYKRILLKIKLDFILSKNLNSFLNKILS